MKVVVIGGTGLIGSRLVNRLRQAGHAVIAASPASGVNTVSGDGLWEVMEGADVVVDVANSPNIEAQTAWDFFFKSGTNLMAAELSSGVRHHVALSVVGTDRMLESGYFRAKLAQEQLAENSGIPFTILRSTQFFEFMLGLAGANTESQVVHLPPAMIQPVAADDVAEMLAQIAVRPAAEATLEFAGPAPFRITDVVGRVLAASRDDRLVIADPAARYFGVQLEERTLLPGANPSLAPSTLDTWLAKTQAQAA